MKTLKSELFLMPLTMTSQRLAFFLNNDAIGLMRFLLPEPKM